MLKAFGSQVRDKMKGVRSVVIGRGGKTPRRYRLQQETSPELMERISEGFASEDSKIQSFVFHGFLTFLKVDFPNLDIENIETYTDIDINLLDHCRKARKKLSNLSSNDWRRFLDSIHENNSFRASIQALNTEFFTEPDLLSLGSVNMERYKLLTNNEIMNLICRLGFKFDGFKNLSIEELRTISQSVLLQYHSGNCSDSWRNLKKRKLTDNYDYIKTLYRLIKLEAVIGIEKSYIIIPDVVGLINIASKTLNQRLKIINSGAKTKELLESKKYTLKALTELDIKKLKSLVNPI